MAELLRNGLSPDDRSGAIVYCAKRRETEKVAEFLRANGLPAEHFHARLKPDGKREVQKRF